MPEIRSDIVDVYVFRRLATQVEVLLLRRAPGGLLGETWQAVHGKIEPGETATQAALRELAEETGLHPTALWQLESLNTFYVAAGDHIQMCPGFAAEVPPDAAVRLNAEHTDSRWVPAEQAAREMMWPGQRRAIREILDEIIAASPAEPHLRIALR